jgi:uncharacterized membrane protein YcfT
MNTATVAVLVSLLLLAVVAVSVSVNVLMRGRVYQWLKPESRPRRWVLFALLFLFAVFVLWFSVWMTWPQSHVARALTFSFGIAFLAVGLTLRWFAAAVDLFVKRRGWPLR